MDEPRSDWRAGRGERAPAGMRHASTRRAGRGCAFTSNNMVVVVRADRPALRERIRRALTIPEAKGGVSR